MHFYKTLNIHPNNRFVITSVFVSLKYKAPEAKEYYRYYEPEFKENDIKEVIELIQFCQKNNETMTETSPIVFGGSGDDINPKVELMNKKVELYPKYQKLKNKINSTLLASNKFYPL